MHKEPAFGFFQKGIREFEISRHRSWHPYLFGFACHFMLDSTCHGYVGRFKRSRRESLMRRSRQNLTVI